MSTKPFLGIIQINFVHYFYEQNLSADEVLSFCEEKIIEALKPNISSENVCYQLYRSSTIGDFCLAVKSEEIEKIYKISTILNNFAVHYKGESYKFNTYTNVGIECIADETGNYCSFLEATIKKNQHCEFAIRITAYNDFAKRIFEKIKNSNEIKVTIEPMNGLFGRYDFLLHLTMENFALVYGTLCRSKIAGYSADASNPMDDDKKSFVQLFQAGVEEGQIKIINERVLVPLSDTLFTFDNVDINCQQFAEKEKKLKSIVTNANEELKDKMKNFQEMEELFLEERRCFIDISRELWEVISTYVPQGMENDSHVNWQILISDLRVTFDAIEEWKKSYKDCKDIAERKEMRQLFLENLRLITDAVNQYYKFLQNVNSQTLQSPLYEIQTQLDAEKMMIAYREFLFEYFRHYKMSYEASDDKRTMFYPIVYPDVSIEKACVVVAFMNERKLSTRLLICRVPSFEYYGRVYDMIPWVLHEASHYIRSVNRPSRNRYVIHLVIRAIFMQAVYKLLNHYSNDYGYHAIGKLENEILDCITNVVSTQFEKFCNEKKEKINILQIGIDYLVTELMEFLHIIFDKKIYQMNVDEDARNIRAIQTALLHFLGQLGLLQSSNENLIDWVQECSDSADKLSMLLKIIHDTLYEKMTGCKPDEDVWEMIRKDSWLLETDLNEICKTPEVLQIPEEQRKNYCFTIRELSRLYGAWNKRQKAETDKDFSKDLWKTCTQQIRVIIQEGFNNQKGFTELYRIFNMIFGTGQEIEDEKIQSIKTEFNILLQEEVNELAEREITIYRESYADLFMAAALGLSSFGYCRQIFQMSSDATTEDNTKWAEAINIHRFRSVAAVLLGQECLPESKVIDNKRYIPMDTLLLNGREYCLASLKCARKSILDMVAQRNESEISTKQQEIDKFFRILSKNINYIFEAFDHGVPIKEVIADSVLTIYLTPDEPFYFDEPEAAAERKVILEKYRSIQKELDCCKHVIYRIRCFIIILSMVGENGYIIVEEKEYHHLWELYKAHWAKCKDLREKNICKTIADYYNTPQSAFEKEAEEMLEDTIQFIQTYYYKNRFKIMLSDENKGE